MTRPKTAAASLVLLLCAACGAPSAPDVGRAPLAPGKPPVFVAAPARTMPKLCLVKQVRPVVRAHANMLALAESASNHEVPLAEAMRMAPKERAALAVRKRWQNGRTLRYAFSGGTVADRQEVIDAANEWMRWSSIKLVHVDTDPSELRILIDDSGESWSYVGTDCLSTPADEPTMVIGWRDDPGRSLHELGHSLGLIHELQIPGAPIHYNLAALRAAFGGPPNNWSDAEINAQIVQPSSESLANGSTFDKTSIMCYSVDASLLTDASEATPWNTVLSDLDKKLIGTWYPK